jgi:hypothetical protein
MPTDYLFLDFDGVLHPTSHGSALFSQLELFEKTIQAHDCPIVISSSWRFQMDLSDLQAKFSKELRSRIIGATGDAYIGSYARFHEINAYVSLHGVSDWRALDDSYWEFPEKCPNLIRCNPNSGVTVSELDKLSVWLTRHKPKI